MRPNTIARRGAAAVAAGALVAAGSAIPAAAESDTTLEKDGIAITKTADRATVSKVGDVVTYTVTVERPAGSEVSAFLIEDDMYEVADNVKAFDPDTVTSTGDSEIVATDYTDDFLSVVGLFGESDIVTIKYSVIYAGTGNDSLDNEVYALAINVDLDALDLGEEEDPAPEETPGTDTPTEEPSEGATEEPTEGSTDDATNEPEAPVESPEPGTEDGVDVTTPPAETTEGDAGDQVDEPAPSETEDATLFPGDVDAIVGNGADGSVITATNASLVVAETGADTFSEENVEEISEEELISEIENALIYALTDGDIEWLEDIEGISMGEGFATAQVLVKKAPVTSTPGGDDELAATGLSNGLKSAGIFGAALAGLGVVLTGVARAARRNSVQG
ncbi:hypothetical protein [Timonella senegalensis]|uniref:DUF7927 domain-containing protein n=1 Tax=Timonella senegalensis TaxID=1465825 RepID=UPI002FDEAE01